MKKALLLIEMEFYDPDSVVPRNSPLLVPRSLTPDDPEPLEPWVFNDQINPHVEPWRLDKRLENEFLNRSVRYALFLIGNQGTQFH